MQHRLSSQQLDLFQQLVRAQRVLDVGDASSEFLAVDFARYARHWTMVGRTPPDLTLALPHNVLVVSNPFALWPGRPPPAQFDVVLFTFPPVNRPQDAECLKWTIPSHTILLFGPPTDDVPCGSPAFWEIAKTFHIVREERDAFSRFLVMRHQPEVVVQEEEEEEEENISFGHYPKKGERYRLAASFRYPEKKRGDRAPIVEITRDWKSGAGPARIYRTSVMLRLHRYDLAMPM